MAFPNLGLQYTADGAALTLVVSDIRYYLDVT